MTNRTSYLVFVFVRHKPTIHKPWTKRNVIVTRNACFYHNFVHEEFNDTVSSIRWSLSIITGRKIDSDESPIRYDVLKNLTVWHLNEDSGQTFF